jgi:glutamate dehydrogenase/leucine dehydrogenase
MTLKNAAAGLAHGGGKAGRERVEEAMRYRRP